MGGQGHGHGAGGKDKELMCSITRPVESFEVLNDLVVDRGPSPYVSLLELFGDEHHMTTVQADGLCVATPTGSTAYSLSAGGSLVHPEIPTLLITPICPHTLSFRPMLLPDSMELRISVPYNSRSTAWASFDGRGRVEIRQGDHIKVTASQYPFPTVCADKQSTDWFQAITRTLKWNERQRQKSFVVVEQSREDVEAGEAARGKGQADRTFSAKSSAGSAGQQQAQAAPSNVCTSHSSQPGQHQSAIEDDEDDEAFDIDDIPIEPRSSAASASASSAPSPVASARPSSGALSGTGTVSNDGRGRAVTQTPSSIQDAQTDDAREVDSHHLRQYATRPSASTDRTRNSPSSASSQRTPRPGDAPGGSSRLGQNFSTTLEHSASAPPATNSASTSRRMRGDRDFRQRGHTNAHPHSSNPSVKAFVVFGADSSDAETSASDDG